MFTRNKSPFLREITFEFLRNFIVKQKAEMDQLISPYSLPSMTVLTFKLCVV